VFVSPTESISLAYGFQISVAIETMMAVNPPFETQRFSVYVWNAVPCVGLSC
jgi:hypothetical protein